MKKILLLLSIISFSAAGFAQKLVLATYQYADNNRINNIRPLAVYLGDSLGLEVEVKSYPTVHAFTEAIINNEVDIALINTFGYLMLESSSRKYSMKAAAVLKTKDGTQDNYKTALLARQDCGISNIEDLAKKAGQLRLGLVNPGSTSGNLVPRLKLNSLGISSPETGFKHFFYCGNHKAAVDSLLNNKTDIAAMGSTEYFKLKADSLQSKNVKLLWLSPEIPLGPVMLHNRISKSTQEKILSLLLNIHTQNSAALELVKAGWSEAKQAEKYILVNDSYYDDFRKQTGDKASMNRILKQFAN